MKTYKCNKCKDSGQYALFQLLQPCSYCPEEKDLDLEMEDICFCFHPGCTKCGISASTPSKINAGVGNFCVDPDDSDQDGQTINAACADLAYWLQKLHQDDES